MKKLLKGGIVLFLALLLAVPVAVVGIQTTEAASKPKLGKSSMTISIGTYNEGSSIDGGYPTSKGTAITVKKAKSGATYTFTSSNKKVATVKGSGKKGIVTGVDAGSAKITVKQKYQGRTTTVGTCKVTVKQASLGREITTDRILLGKNITGFDLEGISIANYFLDIKYLNSNAKYTYTTDKSGLKITQSIKKGFVTQKYTATKAGTYKVTVKETYKKKTRTLGTVNVTVVPVSVVETATMYTQDEEEFWFTGYEGRTILVNGNYLDFIPELEDITGGSDVSIAKEKEKDDFVGTYTYTLKATLPGTVKVNCYYKNSDGSKGDLIGSCLVTIKEPVVKEINYPSAITMPVGDRGDILEYDPNIDYDAYLDDYLFGDDDNNSSVKYGVIMEDENMPQLDATFSSSDKSVVTVDEDGYLKAKKVGTAVITVTAGKVTKEITVTVVEESDYDD